MVGNGEDGVVDGRDGLFVYLVGDHVGHDVLGHKVVDEPFSSGERSRVRGDGGGALCVEGDGGGVQVDGDLGGEARARRIEDHEGHLNVLQKTGQVDFEDRWHGEGDMEAVTVGGEAGRENGECRPDDCGEQA